MPSIVVRLRASADLAEIWAHIAKDSVKHADRFAVLIDDHFRALARRPYMGRSRTELAPDLRSFPVGQHVIFYLPLPRGVEIVRVCTARATSNQSCRKMIKIWVFPFWENLVKPLEGWFLGQLADSMGEIKLANVTVYPYAS